MELLSYGENVTVVEPKSFAKEMAESYRAALEKLSEA
jgi:predicted DNA-binding transcriptional regulator YafY